MRLTKGIRFPGLPLSLKLLSIVVIFQNCSGFETFSSADLSSLEVSTYEKVYDEVLSKKCLHCHNDKLAGGGVYFTSYDTLMSSNIVLPFDSTNSLLYISVLNGDMPSESETLSSSEINLIKNWIDLGAISGQGKPDTIVGN
ncbi:MAG: hypothetical protein H6625_08175 [Bdellovibrionaceae bacterium]|nr:hypothetical protein [Pseudobdellovibrionaceae bacterium]